MISVPLPSLVLLLLCLTLSSAARCETIKLAIASNFMHTAKQLIKDFHATTQITTRTSYGSSGKLGGQIAHGAPFDILLSADQKVPRYLASQGLALGDTQFTYAIGKLSLCSTQAIDNGTPEGLLANSQGKRIALANEKLAPYGAAAGQVLSKLKVKEPKTFPWVRAENVSQVFQFLISQNVDFAFVAKSQLVSSHLLSQNHCISISSGLYSPIRQDAILLAKGGESGAAKSFLAYLKSDSAREIIKQFGYD